MRGKIDGWRIVAYKRGPDVQPISRNGRDYTSRFPDVAQAIVESIRTNAATPAGP